MKIIKLNQNTLEHTITPTVWTELSPDNGYEFHAIVEHGINSKSALIIRIGTYKELPALFTTICGESVRERYTQISYIPMVEEGYARDLEGHLEWINKIINGYENVTVYHCIDQVASE